MSGTVITVADSDPEGTLLVADTIPVYGPAHGIFSIATNGVYTYSPNPNFNGIEIVVISLCDQGLPLPQLCVNDTLIITVFPVNDPPVIANDFIISNEDIPVNGNILTVGDFDPDTTALTITLLPLLAPAHGTISMAANGSYTYTPNSNYNGLDTAVLIIPLTGVSSFVFARSFTMTGASFTAFTVMMSVSFTQSGGNGKP